VCPDINLFRVKKKGSFFQGVLKGRDFSFQEAPFRKSFPFGKLAGILGGLWTGKGTEGLGIWNFFHWGGIYLGREGGDILRRLENLGGQSF